MCIKSVKPVLWLLVNLLHVLSDGVATSDHIDPNTWPHLIISHYSPPSVLLLCVYTLYNLFAHSSCTSLLILFIKSTVYCPAHVFYFIAHFTLYNIIFISLFFIFLSYLYLCIFSCVTYNCTVHGADLTYISLLVISCIIVYVTNKSWIFWTKLLVWKPPH